MPRMRAGARARISEKLLADLATVWEEHGQSVRTPDAREFVADPAQGGWGIGVLRL